MKEEGKPFGFKKYEQPVVESKNTLFRVLLFLAYLIYWLALTGAITVILGARSLKKWGDSMKSMWFRGKIANLNREKKIFIFGSPHAGKSTLLACLVHHLSNSDNFTFRRDPIKNARGVAVIRELLASLDEGKFPNQTPLGFWQSIKIEYSRKSTPETRTFSFQEIAGETAETFDPTHPRHSEIHQEMKNFLLNSNGVLIVASATPESVSEKDAINDFLELLYRSSYNRPVLFVLSKLDSLNGSFANEVDAAKAIYRNSVDLLGGDSLASLLPFSVGEVESGRIKNNTSGNHIVNILEWMESL